MVEVKSEFKCIQEAKIEGWNEYPKFYQCGNCFKFHDVKLNSNYCKTHGIELKEIKEKYGDKWNLVQRLQGLNSQQYYCWPNLQASKYSE